jgi:hypothetical protein
VAGAAVGLVLLYVAFIFGTAVDGKINVDARVHSTILTAFSDIIVSSVVLVGGAHLILRLARGMLAEFAAARKQRECIEEMLRRIDGKLGSQGLAAALKVPTGEFQRVNGTSHVPVLDVRPAAPAEILPPDNVVAFELGRQAERSSNGGRSLK